MRRIELLEGTIVEVIDEYTFQVELVDGAIVLSTLSPKMKLLLEKKQFSVGDLVKIQISPYDRTRGRIHRYSFLL